MFYYKTTPIGHSLARRFTMFLINRKAMESTYCQSKAMWTQQGTSLSVLIQALPTQQVLWTWMLVLHQVHLICDLKD